MFRIVRSFPEVEGSSKLFMNMPTVVMNYHYDVKA